MNEVDVKQALKTLRDDKKMTQAAIGAELGCTQSNVCYHMTNATKNPRYSAAFVERLKATFARLGLDVPMCANLEGGA